VPKGFLFPLVENNTRVWKCPNGFGGFIGTPDSRVENGKLLQTSYAYNGVTWPRSPAPRHVIAAAGPEESPLINITNGNGTSNVVMIWEHNLGPQCWEGYPDYPPYGPWKWPIDPFDLSIPWQNHYAPRHINAVLFLYCDGHVIGLRREEIRVLDYFIRQVQ
jgi:prepilin-type processing-associated H-X9-DG protein